MKTKQPAKNALGVKPPGYMSAVNKSIQPLAQIQLRTRDPEKGIKWLSQARFTHLVLYQYMQNNTIRYSPRYQRGFQPALADVPDQKGWFDELLPVSDHRLLIDQRRCNEMAVRWLREEMTNREVIWNARTDTHLIKPPHFNEGTFSLEVYGPLTIPDSGHRHRAIHTLVGWKLNPTSIPDSVKVDNDVVGHDEIVNLLQKYDPDEASVNVVIYEVPAHMEGVIFYQANNLTKTAGNSAGIDLNRERTPESRFIFALVERSPIFAEEEIERRFTRIGEKSRKLTTLSTLVEAAKPMVNRLRFLEQHEPEKYEDLVEFIAEFFEEYSNSFPAWCPNATMKDRQDMRDTSLAMTNVIVHALFRLAFRLYEDMESKTKDWTETEEWRSSVAKLAKKISLKDGKKTKSIPAMSKENPEWRGKVLIEGQDKETGALTWSISNTRQTRQAAYNYLCELADLDAE